MTGVVNLKLKGSGRMIIQNKRTFYRLSKMGVLGNRSPMYDTIGDALNSISPNIGFREMGKAGGGAATIVHRSFARSMYNQWKQRGRSFIMDGAAPNHRTTLLGEICRTTMGWEGFMAVEPRMAMRPAISLGLLKPQRGLRVKLLIDKFMDPSSRDDIDQLFELYPDSTIEFSCFDTLVGDLKARNTLIWEIRNY